MNLTDYLRYVTIRTLIGAGCGIILCLLVTFAHWDIEKLGQILIPIRLGAVLGFVISSVYYVAFNTKD